jgi:hypothetical protein
MRCTGRDFTDRQSIAFSNTQFAEGAELMFFDRPKHKQHEPRPKQTNRLCVEELSSRLMLSGDTVIEPPLPMPAPPAIQIGEPTP